MARKKEEPIPADLLAMDEAQLRNLYEQENTDAGQAEYEALLAARDEAQEKLHAYSQRKFQITRALGVKLTERLAKTKAE